MSKQKPTIPPLKILNIKKNGPFNKAIRLDSKLRYSDIKDFPIWWSGFFIDDPELLAPEFSFERKGNFVQTQMLQAARKVSGYTCIDVNDTTIDEILNTPDQSTRAIAITGDDSLITFNRQLATNETCSLNTPIITYRDTTQQGIPRGAHNSTRGVHSTRKLVPRGVHNRTRGAHITRMLVPPGVHNSTRGVHNRTRGVHNRTRGAHAQSVRQAQSLPPSPHPTFRDLPPAPPSPHLTFRAVFNSEQRNIEKLKQIEIFSKRFTKLALQSNPTNIGLFVNCTPAEFINKIFYNTEFNIIQEHYQHFKQNVNIYIFNLKNETCNFINKILKSLLNKKITNFVINGKPIKVIEEIKNIIKKLNKKYYESVGQVDDAIKKHNEIIKIIDSNIYERIRFKDDIVKDEKIQQLNTILDKFLTKNWVYMIDKFKQNINKLNENKITTYTIEQTIQDLTGKLEILKELQKDLYIYFTKKDNICFSIYNMLKLIIETIEKVNTTNPFTNNDNAFIVSIINMINKALEDENNKNCFEIKKLLEKKLEETSIGKYYIKFKCFTCNNLKDCAKVINQQLKLPPALRERN